MLREIQHVIVVYPVAPLALILRLTYEWRIFREHVPGESAGGRDRAGYCSQLLVRHGLRRTLHILQVCKNACTACAHAVLAWNFSASWFGKLCR